MSTTSTFQGMDTNAKPSSRVLAPPGGGSSNIFGSSNDSPVQRQAPASKTQSDVLNQGPPPAPVEQPKPAKPIAYNPITGQPYETAKPPAEKEEEKEEEKAATETENKAPEDPKTSGAPSDNFRSTKVSQPPGGRSTKLW